MRKVHSLDSPFPALLALFEDLTRQGVNVEIYENDEMFQVLYWSQNANRESAVASYLGSGRTIWQALRSVLLWRFGALDRIGRVLDFAAGFGRVTRFLVREIPPDRIWVSDLQPEALIAQKEEHGVHTLASAEDPAELELPGRFDAVLVSSLFTHLPPHRFAEWLAKLAGLVSPGGVLALSVHDAGMLDGPPASITFRPTSESQQLPGESYGTTWVSEAFVRATVAEVLGASWQVLRLPRGLASLQDLYVLTPDQASEPAALVLPRQLDGHVERCEVDATNRFHLRGWWTDRQLRQVPHGLSLVLGGKLQARLEAGDLARRPDVEAFFGGGPVPVWGYALETRLEAGWDPAARLELSIEMTGGTRVLLLQGTLAAVLLQGTRQALADVGAQARSATEGLAAATARVGELEDRLRWMESSRFWQLRNRWFHLKRMVRP
ncbi:MAG TPA: hypothetical protein DD490_24165 [Acidobacteria bacterium]|nr:hypothetical protein [Acidobacteriota bacterium]